MNRRYPALEINEHHEYYCNLFNFDSHQASPHPSTHVASDGDSHSEEGRQSPISHPPSQHPPPPPSRINRSPTPTKETVRQNRLTHIFHMFVPALKTPLMRERLAKNNTTPQDAQLLRLFLTKMKQLKSCTYISPSHINHWLQNPHWGHIFIREWQFYITVLLREDIYDSSIKEENYEDYFEFIDSYLNYSTASFWRAA